MTKPRLKGFLLLLLGATIFIALGYFQERNSPVSMVDFKGIYFATRCILQHGDPYKQSDLLHLILSQRGDSMASNVQVPEAESLNVYLPAAFPFIVPFALMPWGAAHLAWMFLTAGSFIVAACLMWELGADYAPGISGGLLCLLLAGSTLLLEVGNVAGIVVSLCAIAAWCFLRERFASVGALCLAISLLLKPHDAGPLWVYFFLAGGLFRKSALRTLLMVAVLGLPGVLWVSSVVPNWMPELRANVLASSSIGAVNDPRPTGVDPRTPGAILINLQTAMSVFNDDPRVYDPATYLLCAPLLLVWGYITLRKPSSPANARLALAAIVALSMLPLYHRQHDTTLLLVMYPACAMLWAEGGEIAWLALVFTALGTVFTSEISLRLLAVFTVGLRAPYMGLAGKLLTVLLCRPAPLFLLAMGIFYLWVYIGHSSGLVRTAQTRSSQEQLPMPPLQPHA